MMSVFLWSALFCFFLLVGIVVGANNNFEYCIVGAGPGGIQLAYFLHQEDYIVLERNAVAGSFFTKYPKQEHLISINKKYTGHSDPEFNLRHDWNSLLTSRDKNHNNGTQTCSAGNSGTDWKFSDLTEDYWPHRSYMVEYLNSFVERYQLNIRYNTDIHKVVKDSDPNGRFHLLARTTDGNKKMPPFHCQTLIWATGLSQPRTLDLHAVPTQLQSKVVLYQEMEPVEVYKNKRVAILGSGQSAFEAARALYKVTAATAVYYRTPPQWAYATHYPGHVRAINHEILDAYSLKSLDAVIDIHFGMEGRPSEEFIQQQALPVLLQDYDVVILAIGWTMDTSPFADGNLEIEMTRTGSAAYQYATDQYPAMDATYQSISIPGLYFCGTLTHGNDKGKSAGGFVHGFRYTTRALARILMATPSEPWPVTPVACLQQGTSSRIEQVEDMAVKIQQRIGTTSGLYQMQSELQDVYVYNNGCLIRYEEVPRRYTPRLVDQLEALEGSSASLAIFTITFQYNPDFSSPQRNIFDPFRVADVQVHPNMPAKLQFHVMPFGWANMNFLHPVLQTVRYLDEEKCDWKEPFHMMEDIETEWTRYRDKAALMEWLLVRTLSSPCTFDTSSSEANAMRDIWQEAIRLPPTSREGKVA